MDLVCGVPQGSVLGPFLFLIYINDFLKLNILSMLIGFADDTPLLSSASNKELLQNVMQADTNTALEWLYEHSLIVNAKKTTLLYFKYRDYPTELGSVL